MRGNLWTETIESKAPTRSHMAGQMIGPRISPFAITALKDALTRSSPTTTRCLWARGRYGSGRVRARRYHIANVTGMDAIVTAERSIVHCSAQVGEDRVGVTEMPIERSM